MKPAELEGLAQQPRPALTTSRMGNIYQVVHRKRASNAQTPEGRVWLWESARMSVRGRVAKNVHARVRMRTFVGERCRRADANVNALMSRNIGPRHNRRNSCRNIKQHATVGSEMTRIRAGDNTHQSTAVRVYPASFCPLRKDEASRGYRVSRELRILPRKIW